MASYLPPTQDLPIFDESVFRAGDEALTYNIALKKFLRYPNAQGKEILQEIDVNGTSNFNENAIFNDANILITDNVKFNNTLAFNQIEMTNSDTGTSTIMTSENITSTNWDIQSGGDIFMGANLYIRDIPVGTSTIINKTANDTSFASQNGATDTITFVIDGGQQIQLSNNVTTFDTNLTNVLTTWDINNTTGDILIGNSLTMSDYTNSTSAIMDLVNQDLSIRSATNSSTTTMHIGTKEALRLGFTNSTFNNNLTNTAANWNIANTLGQGTFVNLVATGTQPGPTSNGTAVPTTAWVTSKFANFVATSNTWTGQNLFNALQTMAFGIVSGQVSINNGQNLQFVSGSPAGYTFNIAPFGSPQPCLRWNMGVGGSGNASLFFQNLSPLVTTSVTFLGVAIGQTAIGQTAFQNYANNGTNPGFIFTAITNVSSAVPLGIIPYTQPVVADSSQNLATTAWVQALKLAGSSVTNSVSNIAYSLPLITSSATGTYPFYSGAGLTFNPSNQLLTTTSVGCGQVLTNTINNQSNSSILLMSSPTVVPLPTAVSGVGFGWNESGGNGETIIRNYAQAGIGGITFATVNATNASATIATISVTQPALTDSSIKLATTKWVKDAIAPIVASMTTTRVVSVSIPSYIYTTNLNNLYNAFQSYSISDSGGAVINWNFVNGVVNSTYRIYFSVTAPTSLIINKPTGTGGNVISNLAGTTVASAGSKWVIETVYDGTTYYMNWTNYT